MNNTISRIAGFLTATAFIVLIAAIMLGVGGCASTGLFGEPNPSETATAGAAAGGQPTSVYWPEGYVRNGTPTDGWADMTHVRAVQYKGPQAQAATPTALTPTGQLVQERAWEIEGIFGRNARLKGIAVNTNEQGWIESIGVADSESVGIGDREALSKQRTEREAARQETLRQTTELGPDNQRAVDEGSTANRLIDAAGNAEGIAP